MFEWNTGETSQIAVNKDSGSYKVRVYDEYNCGSEDSIYITIERTPDPYPVKTSIFVKGNLRFRARIRI